MQNSLTKKIMLYSLGILLPLQAGLYWPEVVEHYIKLSYLPIFGLWLLGTRKTKFQLNTIGVLALALILWSLLSAVMARDLNRSLFEISRYVVVFLLYLYIANYCDDEKSIITLLYGLFIGLAFEDLVGLYQNHYGRSIGWDFLGEGSGKLWSWRAIGTLRFPNSFATYLVFFLPVNISLLFVPLKRRFKIILGVLLGATLAVLIFSYSRSAWLGFALSMTIFLLLFFKRGLITPKFMKSLFPVAIILTLLIFDYGGKMMDRWDYRDRNETGMQHRYDTATLATELIKKDPFFGIGLRNFFLYANYSTVHSTYLRLGAESGIPSLLLFLLIIFYVFREGLRVMKSRNPLLSRLSIGILCGFSAFLVVCFVGIQYRWFPILGIFWIYAGLIAAMSKMEKRRLRHKRQEKRKQIVMRQSGVNNLDEMPVVSKRLV